VCNVPYSLLSSVPVGPPKTQDGDGFFQLRRGNCRLLKNPSPAISKDEDGKCDSFITHFFLLT
jgi:hypothetical protein